MAIQGKDWKAGNSHNFLDLVQGFPIEYVASWISLEYIFFVIDDFLLSIEVKPWFDQSVETRQILSLQEH